MTSTWFAKCFLCLGGGCREWILKFVRERVCYKFKVTLESYIDSIPELAFNDVIRECYDKDKGTWVISELDLPALRVIIYHQKCQILWPNEMRQNVSTPQENPPTFMDSFEQVLGIWDIFIHTRYTKLEEDEYNNYMDSFKSLAKEFEKHSLPPRETYTAYIVNIEEREMTEIEEQNVLQSHKISKYKANMAEMAKTGKQKIEELVNEKKRIQREMEDHEREKNMMKEEMKREKEKKTTAQDIRNERQSKRTLEISFKSEKSHVIRPPSDRARYAKCTVFVVEIGRNWLYNFTEYKINRTYGKSVYEYIQLYHELEKQQLVKECVKGGQFIPSKVDISALYAIIRFKNFQFLNIAERRTKPEERWMFPNDSIGDCIEKIRDIRNTFMHATEAKLDQYDYDTYFDTFKDLAQHFENAMKKTPGTYINQIEEVHQQQFDDNVIEKKVSTYMTYVSHVVNREISTKDKDLLKGTETKVKELYEKLTDAEKKIMELNAKICELQVEKNRIAQQLQSDKDSLTEKNKNLEREKERLDKQVTDVEEQLRKTKERNDTVGGARGFVRDVQSFFQMKKDY